MKKLPLKMISFIKNNNIKTVLVFSYEISLILLFIKKLYHKKFRIFSRCINTITYERKYEKNFFRKYIVHTLIKFFYHNVDYIIAQSNKMAEDLKNNYYVKESQITVINNPLSQQYEEELEYNWEIKKENYILFIGRLEKQKGIYMLLDAFNMLKNDKIKLVIVGEGSEKNNIKKKVELLGLSNRVQFIDFTKSTIDYYRKARVTVLSSYFEGFPNVIIESLACGTPVVSYDCPSGPSEIIQNKINGYLVKYLDVNDLAKKIDKSLVRQWQTKLIKNTAMKYKCEVIMKKYIRKIFGN
jgi:glycosyltransferase involved in cell wall biosynthesis